MFSKNTEIETIKLIKCTNVENKIQSKINIYLKKNSLSICREFPNNLLHRSKIFNCSNNRICGKIYNKFNLILGNYLKLPGLT